jgi:predicted molibdopterin-dependent oxidoreductase YjgC
VLSLIDLALATGHVGRWGSGLNPLRGQNNVQGGGDMGALPHKLPGFRDVEDPEHRATVEAVWGSAGARPGRGWHLTEMFEAMHRRDLRALWGVRRKPPRSPRPNAGHAIHALQGLDHLVVQDLFLTKTAALAHVVLPGTASWCESEGTVTNSERRVQRCRKALAAPPGTMDDVTIFHEVAARLGVDLGVPTPAAAWEELRRVSPMHAGMSYARLDTLDGLQWPCPTEDHPGHDLPARLAVGRRGADHPADRQPARGVPPGRLGARRRATGRRLPHDADHGPQARRVQHGGAVRRARGPP